MYITFIDTKSNLVCATCNVEEWFEKVIEILKVSGTVSDERLEHTLCTIAVLQESLGLLDGWRDIIRLLKPDKFDDNPFYISGKITESTVTPVPSSEIVEKVALGSHNFVEAVRKKWPQGLARAMMSNALASLELYAGETATDE